MHTVHVRVFVRIVALVLSVAVGSHSAAEEPAMHPGGATAAGYQQRAWAPGDAVNIAFVGSEEELHRAMAIAHWYPADPITLKTSLRIAADVLERKPYPDAPVSNLYLWGRKQDLAFEQPVGNSPKQRHHVRFWRSAVVDEKGEPLWLGSATYDTRVEISRTTLGITHRISPDIDSERNKLVTDTEQAGDLGGYYWIEGFHEAHQGRNGGGDPYYTDGRLAVGVIQLQRDKSPLPKRAADLAAKKNPRWQPRFCWRGVTGVPLFSARLAIAWLSGPAVWR